MVAVPVALASTDTFVMLTPLKVFNIPIIGIVTGVQQVLQPRTSKPALVA